MPPETGDASYLWDMLDAARAVKEFVSHRSYQDYLRDRMLRGAVERHVEIIGEAAGRISKTFRDAQPEIPWQRIIGQRHALIHEYGEIQHDLIWKVATAHIPALIENLERLIPPVPPEVEG
jgi:uncharacterized protein with HEPN domain